MSGCPGGCVGTRTRNAGVTYKCAQCGNEWSEGSPGLSSMPLDDLLACIARMPKCDYPHDEIAAVLGRVAALEADLREARQQRDHAVAFKEQRCISHAAVAVLNGDCPICDVEAAESENARLLEALTEIADYETVGPAEATSMRSIARAALEGGKDA